MTALEKIIVFVTAVLWVIVAAEPVCAQKVAPPVDSTAPKLKQIRPGISLPDSLYIARDTTKGDIDTIVRYTAKDSTVFDIPRRRMILVNNAIVEFEIGNSMRTPSSWIFSIT